MPVGSRHLTGSGTDAALGIGDQAPDFELRRTFEETVRLDELIEHRPALLVFYVFDFGHV